MGLLDRSKFAGRESYAEPFDLPWKDDDPGEGWPRSPPAWMALHSSLWLPDEPGIETNQEDNRSVAKVHASDSPGGWLNT